MKRISIGLLVLVLGVAGAQAATKAKKEKPAPEPTELSGQVSRIVDGDTLWLKTAPDAEPVVIRIEGIDAPESCQAGGADATQAQRYGAVALRFGETALEEYGGLLGVIEAAQQRFAIETGKVLHQDIGGFDGVADAGRLSR